MICYSFDLFKEFLPFTFFKHFCYTDNNNNAYMYTDTYFYTTPYGSTAPPPFPPYITAPH